MQDLSQLDSIEPQAIQLVFFDIDGTLLSTSGHYSKALTQQIKRLHQQGIKTAIASGRPSYAARFLVDELSIDAVGVFCTGAEVYDPVQDLHLALHTLNSDTVYRLYQRAKDLGLYCELYASDGYYIDQLCDLSQLHSQHLRVQPVISHIPSLLERQSEFEKPLLFTKLLLGECVQRENKPSEPNDVTYSRLRLLEDEFSQCEFAFAHFLARPDWEFASVISREASKQAAFDQVLSHYNIPANAVMALGDSQSDIDFIRRSGVGVAMGNASNAVKSVADYITLPADSDGVAIALQRLIK